MIYILTEVSFDYYAYYTTLAASANKEGLIAYAKSKYKEDVYVADSPEFREDRQALHLRKNTYHLIEEYHDICVPPPEANLEI